MERSTPIRQFNQYPTTQTGEKEVEEKETSIPDKSEDKKVKEDVMVPSELNSEYGLNRDLMLALKRSNETALKTDLDETLTSLPDYPGFACRHEEAKNPHFVATVLEAMQKIAESKTGAKLLRLIGEATPAYRKDFPDGVNVLMVPQSMLFLVPGMRSMTSYDKKTGQKILEPVLDPDYERPVVSSTHPVSNEIERQEFTHRGGSQNTAEKPTAGCMPGEGSVCTMNFTNVQAVTNKGEECPAFIVLAHELIHSYHSLYGICKDGPDKELCTVGLGKYKDDEITENRIRVELGIPERIDY